MTTYLSDLQHRVHEINVANGWFDEAHPRTFGEGQMLMVTEIAEGVESYRRWGYETPDERALCIEAGKHQAIEGHLCKPEGVGSEHADELIRLMDQCERDGTDLGYEVERKLAYNATRGHRHGGKLL